MKLFVRQAKSCAAALDHALRSVCADVRIALTHYAPVEETLGEEPREIFPFLGSYLLGEVADEHDVDLYLHGHAHRGAEYGTTPGGVPVRNVAQPVLEAAYRVYEVHAREAADHAAQPNR
jgi:Icc-related predicted phosphoesterase